VRKAIELNPLYEGYHIELAKGLILQQHHKAALAEIEIAVELNPANGFAHLAKAILMRISGKREAAQTSLATALELAPGERDMMIEQGYSALERGQMNLVEISAREILTFHPDDTDGLVLMGEVCLARHEIEEAKSLALSALSNSSSDLNALGLLAACKMKRNFIGGLWWRWNRMLIRLGQARAIYVVVGIWVVYRWLVLASQDVGMNASVETALTCVYIIFVLFTISADTIVGQMIKKEVEKVRLKTSF
jgi:tetratricopeptide (TPR) repeat protein